jgi:HSP90 family molecular chaperone
MPKPVLEVNPRHALIEALARHINDSDKTWLEDTFWLLYEKIRSGCSMKWRASATARARPIRPVLPDA